MRILGLDIGTKRIGVAVSDELGLLAQGKCCVDRETDDKAINDIIAIIEEGSVGKVVVGLPLNMDGSHGERAEDSTKFAESLADKTGLPVDLWDERLSTKEAEDVMLKADISRKKRKKVIDKMAAQLILQGYLDRMRAEGGNG